MKLSKAALTLTACLFALAGCEHHDESHRPEQHALEHRDADIPHRIDRQAIHLAPDAALAKKDDPRFGKYLYLGDNELTISKVRELSAEGKKIGLFIARAPNEKLPPDDLATADIAGGEAHAVWVSLSPDDLFFEHALKERPADSESEFAKAPKDRLHLILDGSIPNKSLAHLFDFIAMDLGSSHISHLLGSDESVRMFLGYLRPGGKLIFDCVSSGVEPERRISSLIYRSYDDSAHRHEHDIFSGQLVSDYKKFNLSHFPEVANIEIHKDTVWYNRKHAKVVVAVWTVK